MLWNCFCGIQVPKVLLNVESWNCAWNGVGLRGIGMEWQDGLNYCELNPKLKELNWNVTQTRVNNTGIELRLH